MLILALIYCSGCDQSKYYDQKQKQMETHRARMSDLLKQWQQSEQRYHLLKDADLHQAKQFMSGELQYPPHIQRSCTRLCYSILILFLPLKSMHSLQVFSVSPFLRHCHFYSILFLMKNLVMSLFITVSPTTDNKLF